jgi:hypothetical protein
MIPTGLPVGENLACVPDQGDARGLGPYHDGSDSDPRPGSALHVSLPPTGEAEASRTLRTAPPPPPPRGAGAADKGARQSQFVVRGQPLTPRGLQSPLLPVLANGWEVTSSRYGEHTSIMTE